MSPPLCEQRSREAEGSTVGESLSVCLQLPGVRAPKNSKGELRLNPTPPGWISALKWDEQSEDPGE